MMLDKHGGADSLVDCNVIWLAPPWLLTKLSSMSSQAQELGKNRRWQATLVFLRLRGHTALHGVRRGIVRMQAGSQEQQVLSVSQWTATGGTPALGCGLS